jgi:hypothetical protein
MNVAPKQEVVGINIPSGSLWESGGEPFGAAFCRRRGFRTVMLPSGGAARAGSHIGQKIYYMLMLSCARCQAGNKILIKLPGPGTRR